MSILTAILEVFTSVGGWITNSVNSLMPMFYVATGESAGLTFLGVLAVAGLAFSVVFLNDIGHYSGDAINESALIAGKSC